MKLVEYSPAFFDHLLRAAQRAGSGSSLAHRPFVDYYYASSPWCRLHLLVGEDDEVVGTYGVERMRFEYDARELTIGFGSNFHSFQPGVGAYLFLRAMQVSPLSLVFGGSEDTHRILQMQKWVYCSGIRSYLLNRAYYRAPNELWWRRAAKSSFERLRRRRIRSYASRIPARVGQELSVCEEKTFADDLLPAHSPFTLRFAPTPEYMNWRYNTGLPFVRYRLFRILRRETTFGYVVLNETPKHFLVAHCDGEDARLLAYGVLLSLLHAADRDTRPRSAALVSSHPEMQSVYEQFGFERQTIERPFALSPSAEALGMSLGTANWLVNLDWGDNGLRVPFLDQKNSEGTAPP